MSFTEHFQTALGRDGESPESSTLGLRNQTAKTIRIFSLTSFLPPPHTNDHVFFLLLTQPNQSVSPQAAASPNSQQTLQFLSSVLSQRGPSSLPYTEDTKWLIRQHLLSLTQTYPSLEPKTATFTHNDGRCVNLHTQRRSLRQPLLTTLVLLNNHLEKRLPHSHKTNIHKKQLQENSSTSTSKAFSSTTSATTNLVNSPVPISIQSAVGNNKPEEVSNKLNDQIVSIENFNMEGLHGVSNKQEEIKNIVNDDKMVKNDDNVIFKTYNLFVYNFEMGWSFSELEPIEENDWLEDHERTLGSL
ncbi:hypothetical protein ACFE04_024605 [Oxalis oulophora]